MPKSGTTTAADRQPSPDIDANATSTTTPITMGAAKKAAFYVTGVSGTHVTHKATLQVSPDESGSNWFDTEHVITGTGNIHNIDCAAERLQVEITTVEGGASIVDITIIIK